jgi:hypothetical protein
MKLLRSAIFIAANRKNLRHQSQPCAAVATRHFTEKLPGPRSSTPIKNLSFTRRFFYLPPQLQVEWIREKCSEDICCKALPCNSAFAVQQRSPSGTGALGRKVSVSTPDGRINLFSAVM